MKKFGMIGGALVLALALGIMACNTGNLPGEEALYNEDGRRMVTLTINTGETERALTTPMAKAAADFYEVVFKDPVVANKYYRASASKEAGSGSTFRFTPLIRPTPWCGISGTAWKTASLMTGPLAEPWAGAYSWRLELPPLPPSPLFLQA